LNKLEDEELSSQLNLFDSDMKFDQEEVKIIAEASFQGIDYKYPKSLVPYEP